LTTVSAGAALAVSHQFAAGAGSEHQDRVCRSIDWAYGTEAQDQVRAARLAMAQFNDAGGRMSALG